MAVRTERDPAQTRAALTKWLRTKLGSRDVELIGLPGPQFSGFSNETLLFDVALPERSFGIAVRLEPSGHQVFPDTAFEVAARYSVYSEKASASGSPRAGADEWAAAVTYYIDGHSDKVTLDAAFVQSNDDGNLLGDVYAGYNAAIRSDTSGTHTSDAVMIRLQWQLAL